MATHVHAAWVSPSHSLDGHALKNRQLQVLWLRAGALGEAGGDAALHHYGHVDSCHSVPAPCILLLTLALHLLHTKRPVDTDILDEGML